MNFKLNGALILASTLLAACGDDTGGGGGSGGCGGGGAGTARGDCVAPYVAVSCGEGVCVGFPEDPGGPRDAESHCGGADDLPIGDGGESFDCSGVAG